ncbi:MAG: cobalamin synthesis protein P47K [Acidobacteria bacterium]|nr:MAG: cobalamin synthesis protein P47K [Acidobacteriota bacterium]
MILVGGFLGAGKTTLMLSAARLLRGIGRCVGIVLNDQGDELVDTRLAEAAGFPAQEITGGCFCCRFSEFVQKLERMDQPGSKLAPEFIFAEPVGTCTDLSATILQPLKRYYREQFRLAPLTVLVDPARAEELLHPDADPLLAYLFRKQIAEADLVHFSKADLYQQFPALDGVAARPLSAHTGSDIQEWLDEVLSESAVAGSRILEIDYASYADAEAALGWLNWQGELRLRSALTPAAVIGPLMARIDQLLSARQISIAHLKVLARSANGSLKASLCRNGGQPWVDGALDAPPSPRYALTINLRAAGAPEELSSALDLALRDLPGRARTAHWESFRPSPPVPEHRFEDVA